MHESRPHPVQQLFEATSRLPYPAGMKPVPHMISGLSFFPGGLGLYRAGTEVPPFPFNGVMVVGQDFDTEKNHADSPHGESPQSSTWRHLLNLLRSAGIPETRCFYTNAYMGLRSGNGSNTGRSPGRRCDEFRRACAAFLVQQIDTMRPEVIVCLGNEVLWFFSQIASVPKSWSNPSWKQVDGIAGAGDALLRDVVVRGLDFRVPAVVAVVHPSFRHANVGRRRFGNLAGEAAEAELLRRAMSRANQGAE